MLNIIPNTLKRVLDKKLQAQYKAGFIDCNLALTEKGKTELLDILAIEFKDKLSERAAEVIAELEAKK